MKPRRRLESEAALAIVNAGRRVVGYCNTVPNATLHADRIQAGKIAAETGATTAQVEDLILERRRAALRDA